MTTVTGMFRSLLVGLTVSFPVLAEKVDLRGPAPKPGDTIITTLTCETKEHGTPMKFEIPNREDENKIDDFELNFSMSRKEAQTLQVRILEVKDGEPTKVETSYLNYMRSSEQSTNGGLPNADPTRNEDDSWSGATVTLTRNDKGAWNKRVVSRPGVTLKGKQQGITSGYKDPRLAYPAQPVEVGDEWEMKFTELPYLFWKRSMDWPIGGQADITFKLVEVKDTEQGKVAIIDYAYKRTYREEDNEGESGDFEQTGIQISKGRIERNLRTYLDTVKYESNSEWESTINPGKVKIKMKSKKTIPVDVVSSQRRV